MCTQRGQIHLKITAKNCKIISVTEINRESRSQIHITARYLRVNKIVNETAGNYTHIFTIKSEFVPFFTHSSCLCSRVLFIANSFLFRLCPNYQFYHLSAALLLFFSSLASLCSSEMHFTIVIMHSICTYCSVLYALGTKVT